MPFRQAPPQAPAPVVDPQSPQRVTIESPGAPI